MTARMEPSLLDREQADLDLLGDPAVVARELAQLARAHQEQPAVADVRRHQRRADERRRRNGRAEAAQLRHRQPLVVDAQVGVLDRAPETLRDRPARRRLREPAREARERDLAGQLATGDAAEPVRDREYDAVVEGPRADRVLVVGRTQPASVA